MAALFGSDAVYQEGGEKDDICTGPECIHTGPQSCFRKSSGDKLAGPSFAGDRSRQQDRCVSFLKLDPPPIQCAARVNSLLTEQSSYNFNSVILFSTFTRLTAYSWQRVQFETTTLAHLLATCV